MAEGRHLHGVRSARADLCLGHRHQGDIYAGYAACTWEAEWLAGRRVGDTGRVRTATGVLAEARSWPDAGADKTGGARQARDQIATAAAHGDPGPLRQDLRVNCPPEWIRKGAR